MQADKKSLQTQAPVQLHERAAENLRFIRATMESASRFTGISGRGYVMAGISARAACWLAESLEAPPAWLAVWMGEMLLAAGLIIAASNRKALRQGSSFWSHGGRRLLLAFLPSLLAGGLLTAALFLHGRMELVLGAWLTLYGAGIMAGGLFSIPLIPVMGLAFMAAGAAALLLPAAAPLIAALGFGGLHILFGLIIWSRHDG